MKNNSNDSGASKLLCYLGIFILLLFIILPPLFRVLLPLLDVIQEEKEKTIVMNLTCEKTEDFVEYKLKTTINSNYADSMITDSVFKYEIEIVDSIMDSDAIEIEEYENLKKINNVDFEEEENSYILKFNYQKFDYSDEQLLKEHRKIINDQMQYYSENNFECKTTRN